MPIRCKSIAGQKVTLGPGDRLIAGCELIDGSAFINGDETGFCSIDSSEFPTHTPQGCVEAGGIWTVTCEGGTEVFAPIIIGEDDMCAYAGAGGATVIWPDVGNDLFQFDPGETVPVGTQIHAGQVNDGGIWYGAPHLVENDGAYAGDSTGGGGDDEDKGFCVGAGTVNLPTGEEENWLAQLANLEIPDLEAWMLSGFTAQIQNMMGKLNEILGGLSADVDKIMTQAVIRPEDVCTDDVKKFIRQMLEVMKWMMGMMAIMRQVMKAIKIIQKVIKLVKKILEWVFSPLKIVNKFIQLLNIMGLVDMCVSLLIKTIGRFSTILPILQAQLMSILAMCATQAGDPPPDNKEACEAAGGVWIDPQDLQDLQDMYDKISSEDLGIDEGESIGFCSLTEYLNKQECEAAGGTWTDLDVDTDFDEVDTTALTNELAKQMDELEKCFASPILQDYLRRGLVPEDEEL